MRLVFMDEEWRVFYDRLQKVRHDVENDFQDKEYSLHEEMTKRYNQLYSCNLSVEDFKKGLDDLTILSKDGIYPDINGKTSVP